MRYVAWLMQCVAWLMRYVELLMNFIASAYSALTHRRAGDAMNGEALREANCVSTPSVYVFLRVSPEYTTHLGVFFW